MPTIFIHRFKYLQNRKPETTVFRNLVGFSETQSVFPKPDRTLAVLQTKRVVIATDYEVVHCASPNADIIVNVRI